MRTRTVRWSVSASLLVAAGLALTACGPTNSASAPVSSSSSGSGSAASGQSTGSGSDAKGGATATPATGQQPSQAGGLPTPPGAADPNQKCTNQYNYADDSRNNADINTIGSDTGKCPPVTTHKWSENSMKAAEGLSQPLPPPPGAEISNQKCTNTYNYTDDSRNNADINSAGDTSGMCPPIKD